LQGPNRSDIAKSVQLDYLKLADTFNVKRRKPMKTLGGYVLAFLLGWSGAVWTYSDLIYKKAGTPAQTTSPSEVPFGDSEQPIQEETLDPDTEPGQK
jgi:hypothetical protein